MKVCRRRWTVLGSIGFGALGALAVACSLGVFRGSHARADAAPKAAASDKKVDPALERAREQVQMLDDLYKNAVVSISNTYVKSDQDVPAIMIAKRVFTAMRSKKWHSARLVDASGEPINDENAPTTEFEKKAYEVIRAGQPYHEQVVGEGADRRLLAATVVPAVSKNCIMCHTTKKVGEVLGFLRYEVPVK